MSSRSAPGTSDLLLSRLKVIAEKPAGLPDLSGPAALPLRAERRTVYRPAVLILERGERLDVVIKNFSDSGVRVEFFRRTPITHDVLLDEASLPLHGWMRLAWQRDGASGL